MYKSLEDLMAGIYEMAAPDGIICNEVSKFLAANQVKPEDISSGIWFFLWLKSGYCAQFTDKFHENYFSYIIHIDSGLESNVSAYHRRSVPSSHAFASTLQLHKSASRCISDSS